jgi:hypothetical protein
MSGSNRDPLEQALASLPRDVAPERDLWHDIRATIEQDGIEEERVRRPRGFAPHWYQLAAAVLLVVGSSITTVVLMREPTQDPTVSLVEELPRPATIAMPTSFAGQPLGADYANARASLDDMFEARLAALPAPVREKVERNLADIRVAAREIADTLAQHPSDPLLQELLMSTYQSELQLLSDVTQMAPANATRVDL